jgi:uncharacterized membrane protein YcjF (UPF0283 family)
MRDALTPKEKDSPIFWRRQGVNWRKHSKIIKSSRGIEEIQRELFSEVDSLDFSRFSTGFSSLKEARLLFRPMLAGFLILSVIISLFAAHFVAEDLEIWYWCAVLYCLVILAGISVLVALWRSYFDLYPRATWRYWRKVR